RVTTVEPGARDVFTYSGTFNPFSIAFFANSPAPSITYGFDVLVQEVIAAIANAPVFITEVSPFGWLTPASLSNSDLSKPNPGVPAGAFTAFLKSCSMSVRAILSWGRLGPARLGTSSDKLISTASVYSGSACSSESYHKWFALQYSSTIFICSSSRPVKRK